MTSTALVKLDQSDAVVLFQQDPAKIYQEARDAAGVLMRRYEHWLKIGRAVVMARQQSDEGKGDFLAILAHEGLAEVLGSTKGTVKANASYLEHIMRDLPEVEKWRSTLTSDYQRMHWSSPRSIMRHCPFFEKHRMPPDERGPSDPGMPNERLKALKKHNVQLQEQAATNEHLVEMMFERGDVLENGSVDDIRGYLEKSIDREKLKAVCIDFLKSLGCTVRDPSNPPKKKSGTHWRNKKKAEAEAAKKKAEAAAAAANAEAST
jgi:hypothetical protein